jgi:hypothetical protein
MTSLPRRPHTAVVLLLGLAAWVLAAGSATAVAQTDGAADAYWAIITDDDVYVRAGAGDSYYPFGRVQQGDFVKIVGRKFDWMRIVTTGPAFDDFFGYVRYPATESRIFQVSADGRSGRSLGRLDVLAPNYNTDNDPAQSWKGILSLGPDARLTILETMPGENRVVHKVKLPPNAEGWISSRFVERADPQAVAAWMARQTAPPDDPRQTPPATDEPDTNAQRATDTTDRPAEQTTLGRDEPVVPPPTEPAEAADATDEPADDEAATDDDPSAAPAANREQTIEMGGDETPSTTPLADDAGKAPPTPAERLADLDEIYNQLRDEPIETAEVLPLRKLYVDLAAEARAERANAVARYADARARQLELWSELQQQRREIAELRNKLEVTADEAQAFRRAAEAGGPYAGVGRLVASTVYDGQRLPKLFRLQDPGTGRTIAYLRPSDQLKLESMLGRLIGVVGETEYDGGVRLDVIRPARIDQLAPTEP